MKPGEICPTCHYPTKNGTLRAENAELRAKLKMAVEALLRIAKGKDGMVSLGSGDVQSPHGYAKQVYFKLNEEEK